MLARTQSKTHSLNHLLSVPFIWGPLPFFLMLDVMMELYHQVAFPLYGLEKVKREEYIQVWDRAKLDYLNPMEKINCMYCGYANGLLLYGKEIAGRTEQYWCAIRHEHQRAQIQGTYQNREPYVAFGDAKAFAAKFPSEEKEKRSLQS